MNKVTFLLIALLKNTLAVIHRFLTIFFPILFIKKWHTILVEPLIAKRTHLDTYNCNRQLLNITFGVLFLLLFEDQGDTDRSQNHYRILTLAGW